MDFFKKSTKCNRSYKFKHFIYKMLNTIKYNISISLGFHKFMATKCNNNGRQKNSNGLHKMTCWCV